MFKRSILHGNNMVLHCSIMYFPFKTLLKCKIALETITGIKDIWNDSRHTLSNIEPSDELYLLNAFER